jgi:nucleotide-binding universal stress UspA family protein
MFRKMLVPLDGTDKAAAALPTVRTLAHALDAEVALLRVVPLPAAHLDAHFTELGEARAQLDTAARELAASGLEVATHVRSGDIVQSILHEVEARQADVVVMSTRGRHGLARAVLGSISSALLARSPVPVVLLRAAGHQPQALTRLLVPVDDSEGAALALAAAAGLAKASGARVVLLRVAPPIPLWAYEAQRGVVYLGPRINPAWDNEVRAAAQRHVDALAEWLRELGVAAEGRAVLGNVAEAIVRTGDELEADLVVMGTHARTGPARAVLGSIADTVVRTAERPVLLLPLGAARVVETPHHERAEGTARPAEPAST